MIYIDTDPTNPEAAPGKGPIPADYAFVGIAPSQNRPKGRYNEPFGAKSWAKLQNILEEHKDSTVYVTNLVKTPMPTKEKPKAAQLRYYQPKLIEELKMVQPRRILAFGAPVASVLCPGFKSMGDDHGTLFSNPELGVVVMPTYHLAALGYDPTKEEVLKRDLERFFSLPDPGLPEYTVMQSGEQFDWDFIKNGRVYIDIETNMTLNPMAPDAKLTMVGIGTDMSEEVVILDNPDMITLRSLYRALKQSNSTLVGHHFQFDLYWLMVKSGMFWDLPVQDTMLMAHVIGIEPLSLKHLTTTYTDRAGSRAFGQVADYAYNAEDVLSTRELWHIFDVACKDNFAVNLLHRLVPYMVDMRRQGVPIKRELIEEIRLQQVDKVKEAEDRLNEESGKVINWGSNQQVVEILKERGIPLTETTDKGDPSVAEAVLVNLEQQGHLLAKLLLTYRGEQKLMGFLDGYLEMTSTSQPYLYPRLLLHGTQTGRLSCQDPNLQQVPRIGPLKLAFTSRYPQGKIGLIDLSQAELRIAALLSNDNRFTDALLGDDVHRTIAASVFKKPESEVTSAERKKSKGVTFGLLYGGSPVGLADRVGVSVAEVEGIVRSFFGQFPVLAGWLDRTKKEGLTQLEVRTIMGRRRDLSNLLILEGRGSVQRKAVNTPVQGTASDVALSILLSVYESLHAGGYRSRPLFGVHDSIIIDIYPGEEATVGRVVSEAFVALKNTPLSLCPLYNKLPLTGDLIYANSWAEAESTNENYNKLAELPCNSHGVNEQKLKEIEEKFNVAALHL